LAATASPAHIITLAISDVVGDKPAVIGSGPTIGDRSSPEQAKAVLQHYAIDLPPSVRDHLQNGENPTIQPDDPRLSGADYHMVATPSHALQAAAEYAKSANVVPILLGDAIVGESSDVGRAHAKEALEPALSGRYSRPFVILSGGETTVTQNGSAEKSGKGGPNQEYLLGLLTGLEGAVEGAENVWAIACDTDGHDGSDPVAGAMLTPDTLARADQLRMPPPSDFLASHDSGGFFRQLDNLVVTGPTHTNVNDFRAILVT
jgi:glycerate 2-kinase